MHRVDRVHRADGVHRDDRVDGANRADRVDRVDRGFWEALSCISLIAGALLSWSALC